MPLPPTNLKGKPTADNYSANHDCPSNAAIATLMDMLRILHLNLPLPSSPVTKFTNLCQNTSTFTRMS